MTRDQVRDCVKLIITKCNIKSKFKNKRPGYTWLKLFLQRHPAITLHTSQVQCKIRKEVTQAKLDFWLQEVKKYIEAEKLEDVIVDGNRIFNCDESAFFLSPSKNQVLAPRSEQRVMSLISNNEKENITALIGSNAMGKQMPPMVVYKYERMQLDLVRNAPEDWAISNTENGWMNCASFYEYVTNVFYPWAIREKIVFHIILFLDGHVSHMSLHLSNFCRENAIHIIALYPHDTHLLQPMDVSVFKQLKSLWKTTVLDYRFESGEIIVSKKQFPILLKVALDKITNTSIQKGFRKCGLFPLSPINLEELSEKKMKKNRVESDTDLSWYEKCRFLKYIEKEAGTDKISLFKQNEFGTDEILYKIWKKLREVR